MTPVRTLIATLIGVAAVCGPLAALAADTYPNKPIRLVVPFGPGGGTDIVGRLVAPYLSAKLGQQVIVENRAGAGGSIGSNMVAKAPADGYTILFTDTARTIGPYMQKDLAFDISKDLEPLGLIAGTPLLLLANPNIPVKSFADLITYAKANPGKLNYGSSGNGTPQHFAVELLKAASGIDITHVPYKGAAAVVTDAVGGQVDLASATPAPSAEFIRTERLRPLVVMEPKRLASLPNVPTASEKYPEVILSIWFGLMVAQGTDPAILKKLQTAVNEVASNPDYVEKLKTAGFEPNAETAPQFKARIERELKVFGEVAKKAGIKPE